MRRLFLVSLPVIASVVFGLWTVYSLEAKGNNQVEGPARVPAQVNGSCTE